MNFTAFESRLLSTWPQAVRIAAHPPGYLGVDEHHDVELLDSGRPREIPHCPLHQPVQREDGLFEDDLARFELGELEDVVGEREEQLAARLDLLHLLALNQRKVGEQKEFREPDHGIEWSAELVTDGCEEFRFEQFRLGHQRVRVAHLRFGPPGLRIITPEHCAAP